MLLFDTGISIEGILPLALFITSDDIPDKKCPFSSEESVFVSL